MLWSSELGTFPLEKALALQLQEDLLKETEERLHAGFCGFKLGANRRLWEHFKGSLCLYNTDIHHDHPGRCEEPRRRRKLALFMPPENPAATGKRQKSGPISAPYIKDGDTEEGEWGVLTLWKTHHEHPTGS